MTKQEQNPGDVQDVAMTTEGQVQKTDFVSVPLDVPLKRGSQTIQSITIRKPNPGAMRGLNLVDISMMNVSALQKLLPRITDPALTEAEIARSLDPADLTSIGIEVVGFLLKKQDKQGFQETSTT
ncbi:phage tail assembly protein [Paracandidimonas soli]|uniref:Tail assembly chaperone E/41/14-like protein n=1 Tax=Paracandidimonas soli TaxID=1917182 RepID=A0A4R3V9U7_9BURK|nr:phage tail assembly protein [Paracandidimonas soli]TCV00523.1 tail assembly chaperone E/41/14-like protein [Paracandidimonas soli]